MAMTRGTKLALGTAVAVFLLALAGVALAGTAIRHTGGGPIRIEVHETAGEDVHLAVPGFVVGLALALVPDETLAGSLDGARPWIGVARDAADALAAAGDMTLVSVVKRDERIRIATEGGRLVVDVDGVGERVRIEMPLRTVDRIVRRLDRACARTAARAARAVDGAPAAAATPAPVAPESGASM